MKYLLKNKQQKNAIIQPYQTFHDNCNLCRLIFMSTFLFLISVRASDKDSGNNSKLSYQVSDDHFYVETRQDRSGKYVGDIKVAK